MKGLLMLGLIAALVATPVGAAYKCVVDGKVTFSQTRCAPEAERVELDTHTPSEADRRQATDRAEEISAEIEKSRVEREVRKIKGRISSLEQDIRGYRQKMNAELLNLDIDRASANNNLAGATWEQAIAMEKRAVIENYNSQISQAQDEIKRLRGELRELTK